jgi:hypothetical protein
LNQSFPKPPNAAPKILWINAITSKNGQIKQNMLSHKYKMCKDHLLGKSTTPQENHEKHNASEVEIKSLTFAIWNLFEEIAMRVTVQVLRRLAFLNCMHQI